MPGGVLYLGVGERHVDRQGAAESDEWVYVGLDHSGCLAVLKRNVVELVDWVLAPDRFFPAVDVELNLSEEGGYWIRTRRIA